MNHLVALILFFKLLMGGGLVRATVFNPPGWVFALVWTLLYIFITCALASPNQAAPNRDG